jgi:hypothetical protein
MARDFKIDLGYCGYHAYLASAVALVTKDELIESYGSCGQENWKRLPIATPERHDWQGAREIVPKVRNLWFEIKNDRELLMNGKQDSGWNDRDIAAREAWIEPLERLMMVYLKELAESVPD